MELIVKNIEVFLKYGTWGVMTLMIIIMAFMILLKDRQYLKIMLKHMSIMVEMKTLLKVLVNQGSKDNRE